MICNEEANFSGVIRDSVGAGNDTNNFNNNGESHNNNYRPSSPTTATPYLNLSPSNPIRIFAISLLTHWIYSAVIIVTVCAFVFSSVYCNYYWCSGNGDESSESGEKEIVGETSVLNLTRWILIATILLEILVKSIARGLLAGSQLAYLRILWDWLDVASLFFLFVSIIFQRKAVEFAAAAIVLLKLIPIHPGSINAFIFLCSCAKKLIPVLVYGLIIVWIYGVLLFILFLKYNRQANEQVSSGDDNPMQGSVSASNASTSDNDEITAITPRPHVRIVDEPSYHATLSEAEKSQNFSFGLCMECLPTNFRSLSGSFIQVVQMLALQHTQSAEGFDSGTKASSLNMTSATTCQFEAYALSIIEALVIVTGTLPMLTMTFAAIIDLLHKLGVAFVNYGSHHDIPNQAQGDNKNALSGTTFGIGNFSGHKSDVQHNINNNEEKSCFHCVSNEVKNALCDCDSYFCCLANIQRKLNPYSDRILSSTKFKVFVLLVVTIDFSGSITLLLSGSKTLTNIDFPSIHLIATYSVQICFILYTVETLFRWFAVASNEYWKTIWPAFDLIVVALYWLGFTFIYFRSCPENYVRLCAILMIRMLKVVPLWVSLEQTLGKFLTSISANRHNFFVILICSCNFVLLKYAAYILESQRDKQFFAVQLIPSLPLNLYTLVEFAFFVLWHLLLCIIIVTTFAGATDKLKTTTSTPTNQSQIYHEVVGMNRFEDFNGERLHNGIDLSEISPMPVSNGINRKYQLASSPCDSSITGAVLSQHTQSSFLSPRCSDVLSPLLPLSNELNVHLFPHSNKASSPESITCLKTMMPVCSSSEDVANFASAVVIILASLNLALATTDIDMGWRSASPGKMLWMEVFFILSIGTHIVFKVKLTRFPRDIFVQITSVIDLIVVLATAIEIFGWGMKWVPSSKTNLGNVFLDCAKILSAARGLLLFSRISWLQCISSGLCQIFCAMLKHFVSVGYLWIIFLISAVEAQKIITINVNDTTRKTPSDFHNSSNFSCSQDLGNFQTKPVLIAVAIFLMLLSLGVILASLRNIGNFIHITEKFLTTNQLAATQAATGINQHVSTLRFSALDFTKPTQGIFVPILHFVTNHRTFDIIVMTVIILDALGITLEYFATSERALILRKHYPAYMLFLYVFELTCKIVGKGYNFLKSSWNIFDSFVVTISLMDFSVSLFYENWVPVLTQTLRFFRILRIFQFQPFCRRTRIITLFFRSLCGIIYHICNSVAFYGCLCFSVFVYRSRFRTLINTTVAQLISSPFPAIRIDDVLDKFGNVTQEPLNLHYLLYICGLSLFSLIRVSLILSVTLIFVVTLSKSLKEELQRMNAEEIISPETFVRHHETDDDENDHDKSSLMMPSITPDTLDIETFSIAGASHSKLNNINTCTKCTDTDINTNQECSSPLYKTTTITSSEEINGCKVFFVEAMITTV